MRNRYRDRKSGCWILLKYWDMMQNPCLSYPAMGVHLLGYIRISSSQYALGREVSLPSALWPTRSGQNDLLLSSKTLYTAWSQHWDTVNSLWYKGYGWSSDSICYRWLTKVFCFLYISLTYLLWHAVFPSSYTQCSHHREELWSCVMCCSGLCSSRVSFSLCWLTPDSLTMASVVISVTNPVLTLPQLLTRASSESPLWAVHLSILEPLSAGHLFVFGPK